MRLDSCTFVHDLFIVLFHRGINHYKFVRMRSNRYGLIGNPIFLEGLAIWLMLTLIIACANPVPPTGGQKDKTPPGVVEGSSTPDLQTNFNNDEIKLTFDEWVKLDDAFNQLVVSPPLDNKPEIKLKGKTVTVKFNDTLRTNTTYSVYFGNAVKDITENNIAKDLRRTFSTGPFIDSLETMGDVKNAYSGDAAKDILVMLYSNLDDSVVFKEKPNYVAKTDANGKFNIAHIRGGTYKVFALQDNNSNYLYDLNDEKIAFIKKPVVISDTAKTEISLLISEENRDLVVKRTDDKTYGKVRFAFNKSPKDATIQPINPPNDWTDYKEIVNDSIWYWYDAPSTDSIALIVKNNELVIDTLSLKIPSRNSFLKKEIPVRLVVEKKTQKTTKGSSKGTGLGKIGSQGPGSGEVEKFETAVAAGKVRKLHPESPLLLEFNFPVLSLDSKKFQLLEDSAKIDVTGQYSLAEDNKRTLKTTYNWKKNTRYLLVILPEALNCFYGLTNDSILVDFIVQSHEDFGKISFTLTNLIATKNYVLQLLDASGEIVETDQTSGSTEFERMFNNIVPGNYKIRIIEDNNSNGVWDSSSYLSKQPAERVLLYPLQTVKPNWEVEGKVRFGDPAGTPKRKPGLGG